MPPFQFWFTGAALYGLLSFILPLIIGFIGIRSMMPRKQIISLLAASIVIVLFGWYLAARQEVRSTVAEKSNDETRKQIQLIAVALGLTTKATPDELVKAAQTLAANITYQLQGGNNFAYLFGDLSATRDAKGRIPLKIVNDGPGQIASVSWWVYPPGAEEDVTGDAYRKTYAYLRGAMAPMYVGSFQIYNADTQFTGLGTALGVDPGKYTVDFSGSNGLYWREVLTIAQKGNSNTETINIIRNAKIIFEKSWERSQ